MQLCLSPRAAPQGPKTLFFLVVFLLLHITLAQPRAPAALGSMQPSVFQQLSSPPGSPICTGCAPIPNQELFLVRGTPSPVLFPCTQPPPKSKPALGTRPAAGSTNQEQNQKRSSLPRPPDTPVIEIRSDNNKWAITGTRASLGEGSEPAHSPASLQSLARPRRAGAVRASPLNGRERRAPARTPRQPAAAGIFIRLATCLSSKNRFLLPGWKAALMSAGQPCSPPPRLSTRRGGRLGAPRAVRPPVSLLRLLLPPANRSANYY